MPELTAFDLLLERLLRRCRQLAGRSLVVGAGLEGGGRLGEGDLRVSLPVRTGLVPGTYERCTVEVDRYGLVVSIRAGAHTAAARPWSPVARSASRTELTGTGDYSLGTRFAVLQACMMPGIRFRRSSATAGSVKCSLWRESDGARVAYGTVPVNGAGTYEVTLASAVELVPNTPYRLSQYDLAGANGRYCEALEVANTYPTGIIVSPPLLWLQQAVYALGDVMPDTVSPDEGAILAVEPMLELSSVQIL